MADGPFLIRGGMGAICDAGHKTERNYRTRWGATRAASHVDAWWQEHQKCEPDPRKARDAATVAVLRLARRRGADRG